MIGYSLVYVVLWWWRWEQIWWIGDGDEKVCFGITVVCLAAAVSSKVSQEGERGLEVPAWPWCWLSAKHKNHSRREQWDETVAFFYRWVAIIRADGCLTQTNNRKRRWPKRHHHECIVIYEELSFSNHIIHWIQDLDISRGQIVLTMAVLQRRLQLMIFF